MPYLNPLKIFFWKFRRNERDIVNLYSSLSDLMHIATGGQMLNFGYWDENTTEPLQAQKKLCTMIGELAELSTAKTVLDVGSGLAAPAKQWKSEYDFLDIICLNINLKQLSLSKPPKGDLFFINSTSTKLPFSDGSVDRVISLESAQHFKPLSIFFSETKRVVKPGGLMTLAIPITKSETTNVTKLGVLAFSWLSEHYTENYVKSLISNEGIVILEEKKIGSLVYPPLADYYITNRERLKKIITKNYPRYVETILFKSLKKMKSVSNQKTIDYLILKCRL